MPDRAMLARIHIAKQALGLEDACYRAILWEAFGVESAKALSAQQARQLLAHFHTLGWQQDQRWNVQRFAELGFRPGMATPAQLRKIEATWMGVARIRTPAALRSFVQRRFGVDDLRFVRRTQVTAILQALARMGQAEETECTRT